MDGNSELPRLYFGHQICPTRQERIPPSMLTCHRQRLYLPATKELLDCLISLVEETIEKSKYIYLRLTLQKVFTPMAPWYVRLFNNSAKRTVATSQPVKQDNSKVLKFKNPKYDKDFTSESIEVKILYPDVKAIFIGGSSFTLVIFDNLKIVYQASGNSVIKESEEANVEFWQEFRKLFRQFTEYRACDLSANLRTVSQYFKKYNFSHVGGDEGDGWLAMMNEYLADFRLFLIRLAHITLEMTSEDAKSQSVETFKRLRAKYIKTVDSMLGPYLKLVPPFDPYHPPRTHCNQLSSRFTLFDSLSQTWSSVEVIIDGGRLYLLKEAINSTFIVLTPREIHFARFFVCDACQSLTLYRLGRCASAINYQIVSADKSAFYQLWYQIQAWLDTTKMIPVLFEEPSAKDGSISVMDYLKKHFEKVEEGTNQEGYNSQSQNKVNLESLNAFIGSVLPGALWPAYYTAKELLEGRRECQITQTLIALDTKRLMRLVLNKLAIDLVLDENIAGGMRQLRAQDYAKMVAMMKVAYGEMAPLRWNEREETALTQFEEHFRHFEAPI